MSPARRVFFFAACLWLSMGMTRVSPAGQDEMVEPLQSYLADIVDSFAEIPEDRRVLLDRMAEIISERVQAEEPSPITFICKANSRRSHLGHVWAQTAATYYDIPGIMTFSGGTEATAINIRTVRAFRRAGFSVVQVTDDENPHYLIQYSDAQPAIDAFSKVYDEEGNPTEGYLAALCCDDKDCPVARGAFAHVSLNYEDPKVADDTPEENARYDERCRQIAIEMFYVMSRVSRAAAE